MTKEKCNKSLMKGTLVRTVRGFSPLTFRSENVVIIAELGEVLCLALCWVPSELLRSGMELPIELVSDSSCSCCVVVADWLEPIHLLVLSGPLFTKKMPSYEYRDPHDKPKTV